MIIKKIIEKKLINKQQESLMFVNNKRMYN